MPTGLYSYSSVKIQKRNKKGKVKKNWQKETFY